MAQLLFSVGTRQRITRDEAPDRRQHRQAAGVAASVLSIGPPLDIL
jgi:hypothetical protein